MYIKELILYSGFMFVIIFILIQIIYKLTFKNNVKEEIIITEKIPTQDRITGYVNDSIMDYDRKVINDELVAPWKRPDRYIFESYAYELVPRTEYTRGRADNFSWLGYGVNPDDKNDIVKLFGRQKFPGSYNWNQYYITKKLNYDDEVKIELKDQRKELNTNDEINVKMLDKKYVIHLNEMIEYP